MENVQDFSEQGTTRRRPLPTFIEKLWLILIDSSSNGPICWVDQGQVISVLNAVQFSKVVLPKHFKHNNWQSFVRQLNLYGFRKVYQLNLAYEESMEKRTVWQFKHEYFKKDHPELLCHIKRRTSKPNPSFQAQNTPIQQPTASSSTPEGVDIPTIPPTTEPLSVSKQIKDLKETLQHVENMRQELHDQAAQLLETQKQQQETIGYLVNFVNQYFDNQSHIDKHPFSQHTPLVTLPPPQPSPQQSSLLQQPSNLPFQNRLKSLPSISSMIISEPSKRFFHLQEEDRDNHPG